MSGSSIRLPSDHAVGDVVLARHDGEPVVIWSILGAKARFAADERKCDLRYRRRLRPLSAIILRRKEKRHGGQ